MNSTQDFESTSQSQRDCKPWFSSNEPLFSLFQTIILLAFSIPANFNITNFAVKFLLIIGYSIGLIWIKYQPDNNSEFKPIFYWYNIFLAIVGIQLTRMLVQKFINKIPRHFFDLYSTIFQPLDLPPRDFLELIKLGTVNNLPANTSYALEGSTKIGQKISILLTGRLQVTFDKIFLHDIEPNEFIDSIEFKYKSCYLTQKSSISSSSIHNNSDDLEYNQGEKDDDETSFIAPEGIGRNLLPRESDIFQVSITATESSKIITWDITSFVELLESRDRLRTVVYAYIGKDIIHKLYGRG